MNESVLIVDDEDGVRRTFQEWLSSLPNVKVYAAADAEAALRIANEHEIDLAVLDWNLGSGSHGLQLLEDLVDFQPDLVAILVTGFANLATPLDALRMGVRDYLDKNHDLTREVLVTSVRKQLDRILPAKRQRELNRKLAEFREAVTKVIDLVRGASTLNDPVPLPAAVHSLFRLMLRLTGAKDGALIVRQEPDTLLAYGIDGQVLPMNTVPFARTIASSVVSQQQACVMTSFDPQVIGPVSLLPCESGRKSMLAVPLPVGAGVSVVLELFDKPQFTNDDRANLTAAAEVGGELIRQALSERHTQQILLDAVEAALRASDSVTSTISGQDSPQAAVEQLKRGMSGDVNAVADGETSLKLIEAIRTLARNHGQPALEHCIHLVESVNSLLSR